VKPIIRRFDHIRWRFASIEAAQKFLLLNGLETYIDSTGETRANAEPDRFPSAKILDCPYDSTF
jgi:hypothetical protein